MAAKLGDEAPDAQGDRSVPMDVDRPQEASAGNAATAAAPSSAGEAAAEAEDDDPVVQECDVYLNRMYDPPDFVGDMYVLQYPLRPVYRPYGDQGALDRVELKPKSRRLKFAYKLSHGDNYDEDGVASEKLGQKHVLSSTVVTNPYCSYAVGIVHQGHMTVTPVKAVNQLRPDFEAFDRLRSQQKAVAGADVSFEAGDAVAAGAGAGPAGDSDSGEEEARVVADSENLLSAATVRVEYMPAGGGEPAPASSDPEDAWSRLDYYNADSEEAKDIKQKHIVWPAVAAADAKAGGYEMSHPRLQKLELDGDKKAFLARMCGQVDPNKGRKARQAAEPEDGLSSYVLSRMPVERQVEALVRHFGVISYSRQLRKRLPPSTLRSHGADENLLRLVRNSAVMVAGNWVLKSELAGFEGSEAHARDMLLCLLAKKNGVLTKLEYAKWEGIFQGCTQRTVREEMTRNFAEVDREKETWRLKNPVDEEFIKKFPNLVEEQLKDWDERRLTIIRKLQDKNKGHSSASAAAAASARQRTHLMGEVREVLTLGALTLPELRRTLQKKNTTVAIHEHELSQALQHPDCDAVQVRDLWMLGRTGKEENDNFRSVLIGLFRQRDSVSKKDIMAEYERLHGEACKLSDFLVRSLIREIAEKADRDNYVLKGTLVRSGGGPAATDAP